MDSLNFFSYQHNTGQVSLSASKFSGAFLSLFFFKSEYFLKLGFILKLGLFFGTHYLVQGHVWL